MTSHNSHPEQPLSGMIDITDKNSVKRTASAIGVVHLKKSTIMAIKNETVEKGDVLSVARVAALLAVKDTSRIVPMCHPIPITSAKVGFDLGPDFVRAEVVVISTGKTGVEMEALVGVSAALLNVWDMVKSLEKDETGNYPTTRIDGITVKEKRKELL